MDDSAAILPASIARCKAFIAAGEAAVAEALLRQLCEQHPELAQTWFLLGVARHRLGQPEDAVGPLEGAIALDPDLLPAYHALASCLAELRRTRAARTILDRALERDPGDAISLLNYATIERTDGETDRALARLTQAIERQPDLAAALLNRSALRMAIGDGFGALADARELTRLEPDAPQGWQNRMLAALAAADYPDALDAARRAGPLGGDAGTVRHGEATALAMLKRFDEAEQLIAAVKEDDFNPREAYLVRGVDALHECDWRDYPDWLEELARFAQELAASGDSLEASELAFYSLATPLPAALQSGLMAAHARAVERLRTARQAWPAPPRQARQRLRIAYIGPDFHDHPIAYALRPVLPRHDRALFEVYVYALTGDDGSAVRRAIAKSADCFREIHHYSAAEADGLIRYDDVDLLIDLSGYGAAARPEIICARPARVQIAYLSTPASSRLAAVDFRVSDQVCSPPGSEAAWSETLLRLPNCHLACDPGSTPDFSSARRTDFGLPDDDLVLWCLNTSYKIEPLVFGLWMRILQALPRAVLWLLAPRRAGVANLRGAAAAAGIDPMRLVFCEREAGRVQFARFACADLFVDTLFYGAHTTAVDAAAAGLPVLTCAGEGFASRVAASVMLAAGIAETMADSHEDYVAKAIMLGRDRQKLAALRARLKQARGQAPLFDPDRLTRDLEELYIAAWNARGSTDKRVGQAALDSAPAGHIR